MLLTRKDASPRSRGHNQCLRGGRANHTMKISRRNLLLAPAVAAQTKDQTLRESTSADVPPRTGRTFTQDALREIAFPLGGIGTGTVSLGGYGNLRDWEILNRPSKGSVLPFTFAAIRVEGTGIPVNIRVLERERLPPFSGAFGMPKVTGLGLPHFREATFTGAYPFAHIHFQDSSFPVEASLEAYNPMIPLETDVSSLPVAVLEYTFTSHAEVALEATVAFSIMNPIGWDGVARLSRRLAPFFGENLNEYRQVDGLNGLFLSSGKYAADSTRFGSMALLTDSDETSCRSAWKHASSQEEFQIWWDEFRATGRFPCAPGKPSHEGSTEFATLAAHIRLRPGEDKRVSFVLSWHFPNAENYWSNEKEHRGKTLKNHYGGKWRSAWEPAAYTLRNLPSLRRRSERYRDTLYNSTLPPAVIDAVSSQASIIRTNTVMVLEGKRTLAFEGCSDQSGCCPMNCTHVYNYEQAMAHLFPDLERSMRETDFLINMRPDGSMSFRTPVPLRKGGNRMPPAADGQMGCVMKVYREWRLGGGDDWLRTLWPAVKRSLEYSWVKWDKNRDGVMEASQHNTYDVDFTGPNTMMGTLYLGALVAAAKMAEYLGEIETAKRYRKLFARGSLLLDKLCWNGEYYIQQIDQSRETAGRNQYGEGCLSDQLLGQWFAEIVDLGKLLPHQRIRTALRSVFRHNFAQELRRHPNPARLFALNDEKGLLVCTWPRGKRPARAFVYSDEVWTGIEYQVAAHLIYEGMVKEGLAIVQAVRDRYDGARRNPWDEVECGHHYARAMSSWSLLTALSGFAYSAPLKELRFAPRVNRKHFRCLFSTGTAWGSYSQQTARERLRIEISIEGGRLELDILRLPLHRDSAKLLSPTEAAVEVDGEQTIVRFRSSVTLEEGETLTLSLE